MDAAETRRFALPPVLDFRAAAPLRQELLALRGLPIEIDGAAVQRLGGQCAQVLISAAHTWADDKVPFVLTQHSDEMLKALQQIGVRDEEKGQ